MISISDVILITRGFIYEVWIHRVVTYIIFIREKAKITAQPEICAISVPEPPVHHNIPIKRIASGHHTQNNPRIV